METYYTVACFVCVIIYLYKRKFAKSDTVEKLSFIYVDDNTGKTGNSIVCFHGNVCGVKFARRCLATGTNLNQRISEHLSFSPLLLSNSLKANCLKFFQSYILKSSRIIRYDHILV